MLDGGEADDKIIAVLQNDTLLGNVTDISELPEVFVERLRHYFSTYKLVPGEESHVSIAAAYDRGHAERVVESSMADYEEQYGG